MAKVELEQSDGVAVVTLNRPDALNALDDEMHAELPAVWSRIGADPGVRAIVITGTGRGFCVGMDLKRVGERGFRVPSSDRVDELQRMTPLNNDVWLPTIVAVNGVCAGGGLHFVADADVVLASADASFVDTHVTNGQVTALEPISLMSRIGLGSALRLAVLGRAGRIDAVNRAAHRPRRRGDRTRSSARAGHRAGPRRRDRLPRRDRADQARDQGVARVAVLRGDAGGMGFDRRPSRTP